MQELEKILEEIEEEQRSYEADHAWNYARGMEHAADIIRKHMKNEEDILKFYYCESEDDYYLGQRAQNMYYAKYEPGGFTWFMSRYLPWGEEGYPSEPKEIPFLEWIEGFIRKHMNDGWIPVEERLPEEEVSVLAQWEKYDKYLNVKLIYLDVMWLDDAEKKVFETINGVPNGKVTAWRPLPEPYRPEQTKEGERR